MLGRHTSVSQVWTRIGWCGVDLFFVISGFLISGLLFQEYKRFGNIHLKTFWFRRGMKIYPAFYVYTIVLTATYLVMFSAIPGVKSPLHPLLVDAAFLSSYFQGLSGHTWSLAVEEHFYFVLPLFLLVLMKLSARTQKEDPFRFIPAAFLAVAIASLLLRMAAKPTNPSDYFSYLFPTHLRMDGLFCGVMIGYLFHFKPQLLARLAGWRLLLAGCALLAPVYFLELEYWHMYTWGLTCTYLGFACILTCAIHLSSHQRRFWTVPVRLLAPIGFYSYSIYLWHWIVIYYFRPYIRDRSIATGSPFAWTTGMERAQWLFCVALSIVVGIAMAVVVEQPVLRLRDRWFPSRTRLMPQAPEQPSILAKASSAGT